MRPFWHLPLERKFDVNCIEPLTKTTALHIACTLGHPLIVKALLADVSDWFLDGNNMTALQTACVFSRPDCVQMIFWNCSPRSLSITMLPSGLPVKVEV